MNYPYFLKDMTLDRKEEKYWNDLWSPQFPAQLAQVERGKATQRIAQMNFELKGV